MHNELRYQEKTHAISEKLSKEKKKSLSSPPIFYLFIFMKNNRKMLQW
jgi:hypothetical protein